MNNHRMCKMVFDTLSKSNIDKNTLGKADRVTFEYYQGRYELHHLHFRKARQHLIYCFNNVHHAAYKQRRYPLPTFRPLTANRLIFIFLVSASLPIGIFPSPSLLHQFSLQQIFTPLLQSVKQGDFPTFTSVLYGPWQQWFRDLGLWLLLSERLQTILWRSFIRQWYAPCLSLLSASPSEDFFVCCADG